jgi:hypothetical protein
MTATATTTTERATATTTTEMAKAAAATTMKMIQPGRWVPTPWRDACEAVHC